jgi:hypothetical protein
MRKIMSVQPTERVSAGRKHGFEKAVLKLRREGYGPDRRAAPGDRLLVHLVYRETKSLFNGAGADVAMLLWELQEAR